MTNGSKILGLAAVLGLVGCFANEEPSTLECAPRQDLSATSSEAHVPTCESDDVAAAPSLAEQGGLTALAASGSSDGGAPRTRMPNIKNPDLSK